MITKTINLYTFDELSDTAKEKARDWWRELEAQGFGSDSYINEPIETAAKLLGITLKQHEVKLMSGKTRMESNIYWTLHVQGAGASFDATYGYAKGGERAVKAEFGTDVELHRIARELQAIQKRYGYKITALIKSDSRGHFLEIDFGIDSVTPKDITDDDDEALRELFRDFARWIYKFIDAEYDNRMSDEVVDDSILANEYTFTESGKFEGA